MAGPQSTESQVPFGAPLAGHRRQGAKVYFVASLVSQAAALVRYVAMARFLGPEQLGLAATLVVTAAFFDLVSDMGGDRFLVQDKDGDKTSVQNLVQLVYVGRGVCIALILALFAPELAAFFRAPGLTTGFAILAIAPLIFGLQHLDNKRAQRHSDFRPEAVCMFASEILALLATVIAAWLTHSFTAAIWGAITRAIVFVVSTHLQAKRPYGLQWSSSDAPRFFHFALPLMLNGVMLYVGSQGDRVMVAKRLGAVTIGRYSAVLLLILYPAALLQRYMQALYMPVVAAARDHFQRRESVIDLLGGQTFLLAISMSIGFAVVAPTVVTRLYGARFTEAPLVVAMIGILQSTRFLINWPSTICLGVGHTRAVLASNIAKLLVFPGAWIGARAIGGLIGVVIGFTAGEFISVAVAVILMNRATSRPLFAGFDRLCAFLFVSAAIVGGVMAISEHSIAEETALATGFALLAAWIVRREGPTLAHALGVGERLTRRMFSKLDWAG